MLECLDSWRLAGLRRRCGEGLLRASLSASYSCYLFYVSTLMCLSLWPNSPFCKGSSSAGLRLTPLPHFKLITLWTPTSSDRPVTLGSSGFIPVYTHFPATGQLHRDPQGSFCGLFFETDTSQPIVTQLLFFC